MNIEKDKSLPVGISCRAGSRISIDVFEVDGDDFSIYLLRDEDVKRAPLLPVVTGWDAERALWFEEGIERAETDYTVEERGKYVVILDNSYSQDEFIRFNIDIRVEHPPLTVGDEPLSESFEVDARDYEKIDVDAKVGDLIKLFGRVTKGNDITVHILSKTFETPDTIHVEKAYWTTEKTMEIDAEYGCSKTEPLLIVFNNDYSRLTTKTVDISVQIVRGEELDIGEWTICPFCQHKNPQGSTACENCKAGI
jgi:hypothetical protein